VRTLRRRAIELLLDEWKGGGEAAVRSEDVYRRLTDEGWEVPDYELNELCELLVVERQIKALPALDAKAMRQHRDWRITWVNPDILEETLGAEGGAGF
jgi:hypothetical protein